MHALMLAELDSGIVHPSNGMSRKLPSSMILTFLLEILKLFLIIHVKVFHVLFADFFSLVRFCSRVFLENNIQAYMIIYVFTVQTVREVLHSVSLLQVERWVVEVILCPLWIVNTISTNKLGCSDFLVFLLREKFWLCCKCTRWCTTVSLSILLFHWKQSSYPAPPCGLWSSWRPFRGPCCLCSRPPSCRPPAESPSLPAALLLPRLFLELGTQQTDINN